MSGLSGHGSTALAVALVVLAAVGALELNKGMVFKYEGTFVRHAADHIVVLNIDLREEKAAIAVLRNKTFSDGWPGDSHPSMLTLMILEVLLDLERVAPSDSNPRTNLPATKFEQLHAVHAKHKSVGLFSEFNLTEEVRKLGTEIWLYVFHEIPTESVHVSGSTMHADIISAALTEIKARVRELKSAVNELHAGRLTQGLVGWGTMRQIREDMEKKARQHNLKLPDDDVEALYSLADVLQVEYLGNSQLQVTLQFPLFDHVFALYRAIAVPFEAAPGQFVSVQPEPEFYAHTTVIAGFLEFHVTLSSDELQDCRTRVGMRYCELQKPVHDDTGGASCAHAMFTGNDKMVLEHCEVRVQTTPQPVLLKGEDGVVIYSLPPGLRGDISGPGSSRKFVTGTGSEKLTNSQSVFHWQVVTAGSLTLLDDVFQRSLPIPSFQDPPLDRLMYQDMRVRPEPGAGSKALATVNVVALVFGVIAAVGWLSVLVWRTDSARRLCAWTGCRHAQLSVGRSAAEAFEIK